MVLRRVGLAGMIAAMVVGWMAADTVLGQAASGTSAQGGSPQQLAAMARAAKAQFRPLTEADAQQALARLKTAIADLDARLSLAGQTGQDWRKYLLWDKLQAQVQQPQPDVEVLGTIFGRFASGQEGLELKWFVGVRQALQNYIELSGAVGNPALKEAYVQRLDRLAGQLEAWTAHPNTDSMDQIAESLAWLENAGQSPDLIQAVRACFGRPNVHVRIGGEVLAAGLAGPVDETEPITDVILGTYLQGTGHTVGQTESRLVPDPTCGVFDLLLLAVNHSRNVGSHPPVCVYTTGTTSIGGCKRLWLDDAGMHAYPAVSRVETTSHDLRHPRQERAGNSWRSGPGRRPSSRSPRPMPSPRSTPRCG